MDSELKKRSLRGFFLSISLSKRSRARRILLGLGFLCNSLVPFCAHMGNVCVVISEPRENRVQSKESSDGEESPTSSQKGGGRLGSSKAPKRWINLSSKRLISMKKTKHAAGNDGVIAMDSSFSAAESGGINSHVWQRTILMGERCEPPDFSGLIFYDEHGNPVQDFPCRSPMSPAPASLRINKVN